MSRIITAWIASSLVAAFAGAGDSRAEPVERLVERLGQTRWTHGNQVRLLLLPEESWQAQLELVQRARHHIFLSTFVWHDDRHGREFADRLAELVADRRRSDPGFTAYCMIDASAMGVFNRFSRTFQHLRAAGAQIRAYNPTFATTTPIYDGRLHDKMLIVDGQ